MNAHVETLVEQAKALTPLEQAELLDALYDLVSLHNPAWEAVWSKECEDRCAAIDRGEMQTHDFDEVVADLRAQFPKL